MHTVLINTNDIIDIFDVNGGNMGGACSLLVTAGSDERASSEGTAGGARAEGRLLASSGFLREGGCQIIM